ncbi:MAG: YkgJ family cysteine cluster protein [Thiobacillus sp.]|nr:YkgJ family cysteine cluster protein [Thiobacillus sp.]
MTSETPRSPDTEVSCSNCKACCCRLEVMLISDTGVPRHFIEIDKWGSQTMARLQDGWCAALDRNTLKCTIYDNRPWVCREFKMGEYECMAERAANLQIE